MRDQREASSPSSGAAPAHGTPEKPRMPGALSGVRILVVDDNPVDRAYARLALSEAGALVETASDAAQALAASEAGQPFAAAVLDVRMPYKDGFTLVRELRSAGTPSVLVVATGLPLAAEQAADGAAIDALVRKPFPPEALVDAMANALARAASTAALDRLAQDLGSESAVELADLGAADARRLAEEMSEAARRGDGKTLERLAHTLKSSSRLLGANELADACASIEADCGRGRLDEAAAQTRLLPPLVRRSVERWQDWRLRRAPAPAQLADT